MPNEIRTKPIAAAAFTITLASLANAAARQSTLITNSNNYPAALIFLLIESGGTAPTAGATYDVFLIRSDDHASVVRDDAAGTSDAAITIENAQLLGSITVTATINKNFYGVFDTTPLGPLGPTWGIAIKNNSGQALNATEGNHLKHYVYCVPEVQ